MYCTGYNKIEQVEILMKKLKIEKSDVIELINIYFEFFSNISFDEYLKNEIRIIYNEEKAHEIDLEDDSCIFKGNGYYMITNYQTLKEHGIEIE